MRGAIYAIVVIVGYIRSVLVFKTQRSIDKLMIGRASLGSSPPTHSTNTTTASTIKSNTVDGNPFTIMKFNAKGIGNKPTELGEFIERHNVKVAVIQESKLSTNSRTTIIQDFTTVRMDRH